MRWRWPLRTLALAAYFCIVLLIALQRPFYDEHLLRANGESDQKSISGDQKLIDGSKRPSDIDYENSAIVGGVPKEVGTVTVDDPNRRVTILMWQSGEIGPQHLGPCPEYNCEVSNNPLLLNNSHAVVFHSGVGSPPPIRYPWQFYVFFTQESPAHMYIETKYAHDFYNLTLGFRRDADIPCPYGYAVTRPKPLPRLPKSVTNVIAGKERPVAWFVSNCGAPSGRDNYVADLRKYIDVDVYGACGTMSCPKTEDCNGLLEKRYKFYLAFENSLCKDYATEKFWEKMALNIVTVVLKRSIVEKYAPPGSFIAADDFDSPRALAEYFKKLHADQDLYRNQFEWRRHYEIIYLNGREHDRRERPWCFCKLCRRLFETPTRTKSYPNLNDWWSNKGGCDSTYLDKLLPPKKKTHPT